jgi:hypothetical protein
MQGEICDNFQQALHNGLDLKCFANLFFFFGDWKIMRKNRAISIVLSQKGGESNIKAIIFQKWA